MGQSPNQRHLYYKVRIWQIPIGIWAGAEVIGFLSYG